MSGWGENLPVEMEMLIFVKKLLIYHILFMWLLTVSDVDVFFNALRTEMCEIWKSIEKDI